MELGRWMRGAGAAFAAGVLVSVSSGCGGDEESSDAGGGPGVVEVSSGCEVSVSSDTGVEPQVSVPSDCEPPTELVLANVVEGSGDGAVTGDGVAVQYAGYAWSNGEQFDASWAQGGEPLEVTPLGSAPVIEGWNDGLLGARVGDRRLMVVPPDLGYGEAGAGADIAPNETLVFVVDVVAINGQS